MLKRLFVAFLSCCFSLLLVSGPATAQTYYPTLKPMPFASFYKIESKDIIKGVRLVAVQPDEFEIIYFTLDDTEPITKQTIDAIQKISSKEKEATIEALTEAYPFQPAQYDQQLHLTITGWQVEETLDQRSEWSIAFEESERVEDALQQTIMGKNLGQWAASAFGNLGYNIFFVVYDYEKGFEAMCHTLQQLHGNYQFMVAYYVYVDEDNFIPHVIFPTHYEGEFSTFLVLSNSK